MSTDRHAERRATHAGHRGFDAWAVAERACTAVATLLLLVAVLACANGGGRAGAAGAHDALPQQSWADLPDPGRGDPWQRLAYFENEFRSSPPSDGAWNYASEYSGSKALIYPKYVRKEAAWTYVLVGRDFASREEWPAASRASWDALGLVRKTLGSRPDRERIRRAAYRDLATVARRRNQPQWAELLELSANLIDVYIETPKAKRDQRAFYSIVEKVERAQAEQRRAEAAADRAAVVQAISSGIQQGQAYAAAGNNTQAILQTTLQNFKQSLELGNELGERAAALRDANDGRSAFLHEFTGVVANDVTEVEAGLSFAAREVSFFLTSDPDHGPYVEALKRWAKDKPKLLALLDDVGSGESILAIAKELQAREIHASRYERRGREAPPYVESASSAVAGAEAPTEPTKRASLAGKYRVAAGVDPDGKSYGGTVEIEEYGDVVNAQWDLGADGRASGAGILSNGKLYVGWSANTRDAGLTVYEIASDRLVGKWATLHSGEELGEEIVDLGSGLVGPHKIISAKLPGTGTAYNGTLTIAQARDVYDVRWQLAGEPYRGTGIKQGDVLAVGWAPGATGAGVTVYEVTDESLDGVWAAPGSRRLGKEQLRRAP